MGTLASFARWVIQGHIALLFARIMVYLAIMYLNMIFLLPDEIAVLLGSNSQNIKFWAYLGTFFVVADLVCGMAYRDGVHLYRYVKRRVTRN